MACSFIYFRPYSFATLCSIKWQHILKNRTHVLSFLGKSSSAQTPKTAHAKHAPMSSIRMRHTKQSCAGSMRSESEIIDEFPFLWQFLLHIPASINLGFSSIFCLFFS